MTMESIKKDISKVLQKQGVLKEYEAEIQTLDDDIKALEDKRIDTVSFKIDKELAEKRNVRAELGRQFKEVKERTEKELSTLADGISSKAARYTAEVFNTDETLNKKELAARKALLNGYAAYQDYEEYRKRLAVKISEGLNESDYKSAVRYSNRMMTHDPLLDVQRFEPKFKINTGTNGRPDTTREFFERLKKEEV